jgi:hypothetical protein
MSLTSDALLGGDADSRVEGITGEGVESGVVDDDGIDVLLVFGEAGVCWTTLSPGDTPTLPEFV